MKWNNPATWLMAATIGAVALMTVAHARSPADCSRLSMAVLDEAGKAVETEDFRRAVRSATSPEDAARRWWALSVRRAFPRCPSPLPADATFYDPETGEETPAAVVREDFVRTMSYIMQFAMAAEAGALQRSTR